MARLKTPFFSFGVGETVIVIFIISIFVASSSVVLNWNANLVDIRNAKRTLDVKAISDAVYEYYIDNGKYPDNLTNEPKEICYGTDKECEGKANFSELLNSDNINTDNNISSRYLSNILTDPLYNDPINTGYQVHINNGSRVVVTAKYAEGTVIGIIR